MLPKGPLHFLRCFATEWMLQNPKGSTFRFFFGTVRFFENFSMCPKGPLHFFDFLQQEGCLKIPNGLFLERQGAALAGIRRATLVVWVF